MAATARVDVKPALLRWARERVGLSANDLAERFPKLPEWEAGTTQPTMRQLESFASATTVPFGVGRYVSVGIATPISLATGV